MATPTDVHPEARAAHRRAAPRSVDAPHADEDLGKLLLRLTIGGLMLLHGIAKLQGGVDGIAGMLSQQGWPSLLAYGVYLGEVAAPLLILVGLWTRPAALVVAVNMVFAILLAHADDVGRLGETGGWAIELQAAYLCGALAIALLGAGRLAVGGRRWN